MTDKPVATGSGEPKPCIGRIQHEYVGGVCFYCGVHKDLEPRPTPPASQPTVTLDREIEEWAKRLACYYPDTPSLLSRDNAMDRQEIEKRQAWFRAELQQFALALLRAAEQK